jgi:hypothetical protein
MWTWIKNTPAVGKSILTWDWTKQLLYWIVISAGTVSEGAFLVSSLWVTLNASVHPLITLVIPEAVTIHLTGLATAAFVGLPECILALAICTTIGHLRIWVYNKRDYRTLCWAVLYGLPTLVFLGLSLYTVGSSMLQIGFTLPPGMVVVRGLAGYTYGVAALLYWKLGTPQEVDRLQQKDETIAALQAEMQTALTELRTELITTVANLRAEKDAMIAKLHQDNQSLAATIESQSAEIAQEKSVKERLQSAVDKSEDAALGAYSDECITWLKSGAKTVSIEEITRYTGFTKRKIEGAISKGMLQTASRNKELILLSSLVMWLKSVQPSTNKNDETPLLHIVNG